jgi:TRAP-type uncharacterized transport system substrate-binding protein
VTVPTIDHDITVSFQGDWGQANFHRVCGWLSQEMIDRSGPGSKIWIRNGRGGKDAIDNVLSGEVDAAIMTPTAATGMLAEGVGPYAVDGAHRLRALATFPQRDRLVTAIDADLGVTSMNELADHLPELRIATSADDGVNIIGLAAHRQLSAVGVTPEVVRAAGGSFIYDERPFPALAAFRDGTANVLIHEAIMTKPWQRIADNKDVIYLDATPEVAKAFEEWSWPLAQVEKGYFPGLERDLTTVDFADWLLFSTQDLADDVAELIAWCSVATRESLEAQYRHFPANYSPLTMPLDPEAIATTRIPLHPGAAAAYAALEPGEIVTTLMPF